MFPPGTWRVDVIILLTYQLLQMYSSQQLYTIFLNYAPPVACFDDHCVKLKDKCYEPCPSCPDECPKNVSKEAREECKKGHEAYFLSPMMEYKLKCLPFTSSTSSAEVQYLGALVGNLFVGILADRFGRRRMLLISLTVGIPTLFFSAFLNGIGFFYFGRTLLGVTIAGTMAVGWAFCAELISPKHRFKLRTFTSWTNGRLLMVAITHLGGTWRISSYLHAAAALLPFMVVFFLPEPPMWLKKKELYEREEEARKRLDWINGLEPKEDSGGSKETAQKQKVARISFLRGLRDKDLRTSFLTLMVMWFCAGLSTYSIDLNGEDMTKNLWLGQYMNSLLASILRVIVGFADAKYKWLGRRKVYIISMGTCILASVALFVELLLNMKGQTIYFLTYLTAYNSIAISWEPNYMGAAELIPTELRATSTAFLNVVTRIANVFAARTVTLLKGGNEPAIMIVVLASNLLSFTVTFLFLKETKGVSLDKVGALQKDQKPRTPSVKEKSRSRSDRSTKGSKESKGSRESLVSKSGSKETTSEVKKEEPATGSKESAEKSDEKKESGGNLSPASKGSAESKPDKGSDEDVKKDEKKDSGSAEPLNEEK
ncbi:hypothetical protein Y032_0004g2144 [Ancylostoma ceylanicum]|uniref:Major facilitator superfamily (MFS) profile domain-containing protein n=1 Tax=Ancylostoma ceylanicum TaxID=53326 RepID=A0A016VWM8_9BILA|nr:hypothetical protein Y032_0004g2144 [Ancylostoma ceylanicum]